MGTFQDLTGQQSGTLIANKYLGNSLWQCQCQKCGNIININTSHFNKNKILGRDGCKHAQTIAVGNTFGMLTVISQAQDYIKPKSGAHERQWHCRCLCGREKDILECNLKAYKSLSCGLCNNRISIPEKMIVYYLSQIFDNIEENYRPDFLDGKEIDIFIPAINLGIEYDGERWHQNLEQDIHKNQLCTNHQIQIIRIREPKCPDDEQLGLRIITPKPTTNGTHMTLPIQQLIALLKTRFQIDSNIDIDCLRDNADICKTIISTAGFNSLALKFPEIAKEWDFQQNAPLTPDKVPAHSGKKAFWICPKGHSYSSVIASRTGNDACGCPICSNVGTAIYQNGMYIGEHSLLHDRPDIAKEFMEDKNGISADNIAVSSNKKMWFRCSQCGHEWASKVNNRTSKNAQGCPKCARQKQKVTRRQNTLKQKSSLLDSYPELCNEWDLDQNTIQPWEITSGSGYNAYWICPKGHHYQTTVNHRTSSKASGCPICAGKHHKIQNIDTGEIFDSLATAAKSIGVKIGDNIRSCCKGKQLTAGGYHWQYIN